MLKELNKLKLKLKIVFVKNNNKVILEKFKDYNKLYSSLQQVDAASRTLM